MTDFRQRYEKQWYFKLSFGPLVIDLIQQCITIYLKHLWRLANPETLMDLNLLRGICKLILAWNLRIWKLWYWPTGYILKWELAVRIDSIDDFSSRLVWHQVRPKRFKLLLWCGDAWLILSHSWKSFHDYVILKIQTFFPHKTVLRRYGFGHGWNSTNVTSSVEKKWIFLANSGGMWLYFYM